MSSLLQTLPLFLSQDPSLRLLQGCLLLLGCVVLFLLFWTLRDLLLRTDSFWVQIFCLLLVALLPVIGFLLYLLVRPSSTRRERRIEAMLQSLTAGKRPVQGKKKDVSGS